MTKKDFTFQEKSKVDLRGMQFWGDFLQNCVAHTMLINELIQCCCH